jgi:hypothetical protein
MVVVMKINDCKELLASNENKASTEQVIGYYRFYLNALCTRYLTLDQVYSLALNEQNAFDNQDVVWYLRAVSKLNKISHQNHQLNYDMNTKARELGRYGEDFVIKALKHNKWKVHTKPNKSLRPRYGNSTVDYDIIASWQGSEPRHIEVKTINDSTPFIYLSYKMKMRFEAKCVQQKYQHHYLTFVWRGEIYYVRSTDIKYIGGVANCNFPKYNFLWIVDPSCLKKI